MKFTNQIINGLSLGSIYALVALGYNMVYGIVNLINFAHGDIIMVGSYVTYMALVLAGLPLWAAAISAVVFCAFAGVFIQQVAYQRLINSGAPRISLLITAIGASIFLQNLFQLLFSSSGKSMPSMISGEPIIIGELEISYVTFITILVSVVLMAGLQVLVKKTRIGKAMRATSEDSGAATLMGINTNRTILFTFALGSGLAAMGSVLYCSAYPLITPYMGGMLGLKAFVAAVLGGIGSIPGAMVGGYLIAISESLTKALGLSKLTDAVVFGILIIILLVKPSGLMGKNTKEKV